MKSTGRLILKSSVATPLVAAEVTFGQHAKGLLSVLDFRPTTRSNAGGQSG